MKLKAEQAQKGSLLLLRCSFSVQWEVVITRASVQPCSGKGSGAGMGLDGFQVLPEHFVVFRLIFDCREIWMRSRFPHTSWDTFDCGTAHAGAPAAIEEKVVSLQSVGTQILPKPSRTEKAMCLMPTGDTVDSHELP